MSTALYRRYRPETFADVIGQEHVTDPLRAALRSDRITHAYLFSGPRGCGKTTSARIFARCLNCAEGPTDTPCGTCPSCVDLARNGSGSLDVVEMDAASHGGVDDARELRERAAFAPARDRYKIFVIDEAHMVTSQGFNALLKLVEEPPAHVKFVFATTEPEKVIGTIRSRTHHYPFRLVPPERLQGYLEELCVAEGVQVDAGVLPLVVRAGGGSVRDSLSVLDQLIAGAQDGEVSYERAVALLGYTHAALLDDVVDALAARDGASLFRVVDRVIDSGHDPRRFAEDLLERIRDLIVIAVSGEHAAAVLRALPSDQFERMRVQSQQLGPAELSRAGDLVNDALTEMSGATSPRLQLELMCARLLLPGADDATRGHSARLDRIERHLSSGGGAGAQAPAGAAPAVSPAAPAQGAPAPSAPAQGPPAPSAPAQRSPAQSAPAQAAPETAQAEPPAPQGVERPAGESRTQPSPDAEQPTSESSGPPVPPDSDRQRAVEPAAVAEPAAQRQAEQPEPVERPAAERRAVEQSAPEQGDPAAQQSAHTSAAPRASEPAGVVPSRAPESRAEPSAEEAASSWSGERSGSARESAAPATPPAAPSAPATPAQPASPALAPAPAPAAPASATPAQPAPESGADADLIRRRWSEVLATLARFRRSTWALVSQNAQVGEVSGGVLHLAFATSGLAHAFRGGAHTEPLQRALSETLGVELRIEPVLSQAAEGGRQGDAPYASTPPSPGWGGADTEPAGDAWGRSAEPAGDAWGRPAEATRAPEARDAAPAGGAWAAADAAAGAPAGGATRPTPSAASPGEPAGGPSAGGRSGGPDRRAPQREAAPSPQRGGRPDAAAEPPPTRIAPADDTPSMDDEDAENSGLVGAPLIERMLGGTIISED